jgi:hypothetical protein
VANLKEESENKDTRTRQYRALGAKEVVYSAVAATVSFVAAAAAAIHREFNEEFKSRPMMRDFEVPAIEESAYKKRGWFPVKAPFEPRAETIHQSERTVTMQGLSSMHEKALFDHDLKLARGQISPEAHRTGKRDFKTDFAKRRAELLENTYGIRSKGFWNGTVLGTWDRLRELGKSTDRWTVGFAGISAAAVVGVTVYNLLTSIATRKKAREIEDILLDKALLKTDRPEVVVIEHKEGEPTAKVSHVSRENTVAADQAVAMATSR